MVMILGMLSSPSVMTAAEGFSSEMGFSSLFEEGSDGGKIGCGQSIDRSYSRLMEVEAPVKSAWVSRCTSPSLLIGILVARPDWA